MVLVNVEYGRNSDEVNQTSFSFNIKPVNIPALEKKLEDWSEELG